MGPGKKTFLRPAAAGASGERERLLNLAWQSLDRAPAGRSRKVFSLARAVREGGYRVESARLGSLLLMDDLNLGGVLAQHPALIPEHISRYGRKAVGDLLKSLDARDCFSGRHCLRATVIALKFAGYLGLPATDRQALRTAGYLHDLGKLDIDQTILCKQGTLSAAERRAVESHPGKGLWIAGPLGLSCREQEIILHHHEYWDGGAIPPVWPVRAFRFCAVWCPLPMFMRP